MEYFLVFSTIQYKKRQSVSRCIDQNVGSAEPPKFKIRKFGMYDTCFKKILQLFRRHWSGK